MLAYLSIHYMFQEVNYELQETDNVQGQIYKHVFTPNGGFCVYHPSNIFVMYRTKIEQNIYKQLYLFTAFSQFSIHLYEQTNMFLLLQQQKKSLPT